MKTCKNSTGFLAAVSSLQRGANSAKFAIRLRTGVRLATKKGPAVELSGPDVSVTVPLDGVDAKLSIASSAPNEQRVKARSVRGLKSPECKAEFFFIISSFLTPILRGLLFLFEGNRSDSRTAEIAPHGDLLRVAR